MRGRLPLGGHGGQGAFSAKRGSNRSQYKVLFAGGTKGGFCCADSRANFRQLEGVLGFAYGSLAEELR